MHPARATTHHVRISPRRHLIDILLQWIFTIHYAHTLPMLWFGASTNGRKLRLAIWPSRQWHTHRSRSAHTGTLFSQRYHHHFGICITPAATSATIYCMPRTGAPHTLRPQQGIPRALQQILSRKRSHLEQGIEKFCLPDKFININYCKI